MITHVNTTFDELITGITNIGEHDHMQLILSQNPYNSLGKEYLFVTQKNFCIVKLAAMETTQDHALIKLKGNKGKVKQLQFDYEDRDFKFLLIDLVDIMDLVFDRNNLFVDDMLEFDF